MSDGYSSALAMRPRGQKPRRDRRDDDNDRYGGSRRDGGNRAGDRGEYEDRHQISEGSGRGSGRGSTRERRFIPCTMWTMPKDFAHFLCGIFKVSMEKVEDWCDDEYIRIDREKDPRHDPTYLDIDPLREVVPKQDWERYEKAMRRMRNDWEARDHMARLGIRPGRPHPDYEEEEDEEDEEDDEW